MEPIVFKPEQNNVTFNLNTRPDIDYKGYKRYFYEFGNPSAEDKELHHCIISAPTIEEAVDYFTDQIRREGWYQDAVISVTVIGIDIRPEGSDVWLAAE